MGLGENRKGFSACRRLDQRREPTECSSGLGFALQFHAKAVRDSVDEGKVRGDQRYIQNGSVAPTGLAKQVYIAFAASGWVARKFFYELEAGKFRSRNGCVAIVVYDSLDQQIVLCFFAETLRMVLDSILAVIRFGDHDRNHFPKGALQF